MIGGTIEVDCFNSRLQFIARFKEQRFFEENLGGDGAVSLQAVFAENFVEVSSFLGNLDLEVGDGGTTVKRLKPVEFDGAFV